MLGGIFSNKSGINANYTFSSTPTFVSEPWAVYTAKPKNTSKYNKFEKCSVFIFDKKKYEQYLSKNGLISSSNREYLFEAYALLKKQVSNLTKLKHPNILKIIEPIEEHSKNFMFVSEHVSGSLDSVYHKDNYNSMYGGGSNEISSMRQKSDDSLNENEYANNNNNNTNNNDVVFQRGLLQLIQGLDFLHNTAKSVLLDLQPTNIYITENSDWKIGGLMHLCSLPTGSDSADIIVDGGHEYHPRLPTFLHIPLDYTAPEIVIDNQLSCKNDLFSLGCIIYFLYYGTSLFNCENSFQYYRQEYAKFERKLLQLGWDKIFPKLTNTKLLALLPRLMNRDVYSRFDNVVELFDEEFCKDPLITTLVFLDDFPTKKIEEKKIFLNGLIEYLPKFPKQISQKSILPHLINVLELGYNVKSDHAELLPVTLELILIIGANFSQLTFSEKVYSHLKIQDLIDNNSSIVLFKYLDVLKKKVKSNEFIEQVLKPLLKSTMNANVSIEVQEWSLKTETVELVLETLDFSTIKNFYFPIIAKTFTMTTSLNVKILCARCFHTMVSKNSIDKYQAMDDILPLFAGMKTRDPRILLTSLPIFVQLSDLYQEDETIVVSKIVPLLWNFSMADTLTFANYEKFNKVINNISLNVQKTHALKLQKKEANDLTLGKRNDSKNSSQEEQEIFTKLTEKNATENIYSKKKEFDEQEKPSIISVAPMKPSIKGTKLGNESSSNHKTAATLTPSQNNSSNIMKSTHRGREVQPTTTTRVSTAGHSSPLVALNPKPRARTNHQTASYNYFKDENTTDNDKSSFNSSQDEQFSDFVHSGPLEPTLQPNKSSSTQIRNTNTSSPVPPGFSSSLLQPSSKNSRSSPTPSYPSTTYNNSNSLI